MDQDKIIQYLEKNYCSRRDMLSRIPLGMQPNTIWKELIKRRRSKATTLPLTGSAGKQYWYVTTEKMIATSEKIVATLYEYETDFDPYAENIPVVTLEETFYTSFVEGSQITMQQAMDFLTSDRPPEDIEEQLITNNRLAGSFAASDLCRMIDAPFLQELIGILTEGMDTGGREFRSGDLQDFISFSGETFFFPLRKRSLPA